MAVYGTSYGFVSGTEGTIACGWLAIDRTGLGDAGDSFMVEIDGVPLMGGKELLLPYILTNACTLATAINNWTSAPDYTAYCNNGMGGDTLFICARVRIGHLVRGRGNKPHRPSFGQGNIHSESIGFSSF